jgi:hypothetical protein
VSLLGPLNLKRRYSYCAGCQQGFAPSHKALGLPESEYTAHLEDAATLLATTVPHAMAMQLLGRCCGTQLSVKASEQMVARRATALRIRSLAGWLPIPVLLILDLFHVKHRIWQVAHSLYGEHSAKAREWAEIQAGRIEDGQPAKVLQALRFLKPHRRSSQTPGHALVAARSGSDGAASSRPLQ